MCTQKKKESLNASAFLCQCQANDANQSQYAIYI